MLSCFLKTCTVSSFHYQKISHLFLIITYQFAVNCILQILVKQFVHFIQIFSSLYLGPWERNYICNRVSCKTLWVPSSYMQSCHCACDVLVNLALGISFILSERLNSKIGNFEFSGPERIIRLNTVRFIEWVMIQVFSTVMGKWRGETPFYANGPWDISVTVI